MAPWVSSAWATLQRLDVGGDVLNVFVVDRVRIELRHRRLRIADLAGAEKMLEALRAEARTELAKAPKGKVLFRPRPGGRSSPFTFLVQE